MKREDVLKTVINIFSMMTDAKIISEESELIDDLGISSMDILMLIAYIEEEFHIRITERSIRRIFTVGDVVDVILRQLS